MAIIAAAVKLDSRGPVFFRQSRVGREDRTFEIFKFRTMVDGADAEREALAHRNEAGGGLFKIEDDPRITRVGGFLRRTSLDELPQLLNVLRGDMSLVGPRPLVARRGPPDRGAASPPPSGPARGDRPLADLRLGPHPAQRDGQDRLSIRSELVALAGHQDPPEDDSRRARATGPLNPAEASAARGLPVLDPLEVSSGVVLGSRHEPDPGLDAQRPSAGPRETLEGLLLEALRRPPCVVAFSGGRDSSAMLAEVTRVARAHGLEDPVAHTLRFGDHPRTSEDEWQELVIGHLGLESWSRRTVTDELDALGPIALDVIRRYGIHWPPNVHTFKLLLEPATGGSLVTGNGGDELFSPWNGHRISLLRRRKVRPDRYDVKPLLLHLLPKEVFIRRSLQPWPLPAALAGAGGRARARAHARLDVRWN